MANFAGFPKEGIAFLKNLAKNNNREWFEAHKADYLTHLRAPAQDLIEVLGQRLQTISSGIRYDTRANGSGSLVRINRDTRFSPDKSPYKTSIGLIFWEGEGKKFENPAYDFHLEAHAAIIRCGIYRFPPAMLEAYRSAVLDEGMGAELVQAIEAVKASGDYKIGGEHYKRVPRGFDPDHPRAQLLRFNGLGTHSAEIPIATVTSPAVVEAAFRHCENSGPIFKWLVKLKAQMK